MMLYLKKRLSKSGLTPFSVLIFYHIAVLLLLTHCCGGQFQVVGPLQPVIVKLGEDVILPCHLKPAEDAAGMTFEWARPDLNPRFVHVWHERQDLHVNQHPSYKGRTSVSINGLKQGDISLALSKVKISDNGIYRCYFPDVEKASTVHLIIGTASFPAIGLAGIDRSSSGVVLQCESKGWYPEPEVVWLDGEGNLLSAGPTETVRGPDDLYTVSSRVTVEKRHSNSFTCRVQQKKTNQTKETHIDVPDDFFVAPASSAACISISLVACFTCVLAVVFAVWKWRQNKTKTCMTALREKEQLMAESKKVKDTEKKMKEELRRKEEQHKDMVATLMTQKKELEKQRDRLKEQKVKVEEQVEENEKKLQSMEKDTEKDENKRLTSAPAYRNLKELTIKYKWELNGSLKVFEELLLDTEKLLEKTESVIGRTTENKKEAENHMDEH
ncbi:butyrophilin subfamily 3 member A2-like [Dicentrarchus labrax]|uniref:butyrophilin subfamily 3 member A2-like n=1 Tax=Dicentrarchus labrax TaxID=13489 RepID=UPI0021F5E0BA|nr:butyrophilin subfamily 3 member A2-like [Dicentrarchus labrax]